jgi:hypothetical protein
MKFQENRFLDFLTVRWIIPMIARRGDVQVDLSFFPIYSTYIDSRPQYPRYGSAVVVEIFRKPKFYWQEQFLINFQWNQ